MKRWLIIALTLITLTTQLASAKFVISEYSNGTDSRPSLYGDIIVWHDEVCEESFSDIYAYNMKTNQKFKICTAPNHQCNPAIYGNTVVWEDERNGNSDIYGYDLKTKQEFEICTAPNHQFIPRIYGNTVVWEDRRNGNKDIYGYNLETKQEFEICTEQWSQTSPQIHDNIVVWQDERSSFYNTGIYGYNLETKQEFEISTKLRGRISPIIHGDIIIWEGSEGINELGNIYGYNLITKQKFVINDNIGLQRNPAIHGNIVVWTDESSNITYGDIFAYNIKTQQKLTISYSSDEDMLTAIHNDIIVWRSIKSDTYNEYLYAASLRNGDELFNAIEIFIDTPYNGTTIDATGADISSCSYNDFKDMWHSFTPPATGTYTISLCGSSFDTTLAVYSEDGKTEVACNDDFCGTQSQVEIKAKADTTYKIRVAGYDGASGDYTLTVTGPAECTNRPSADISGDCKVDLTDIAILTSQWLDCGLEDQSTCWD